MKTVIVKLHNPTDKDLTDIQKIHSVQSVCEKDTNELHLSLIGKFVQYKSKTTHFHTKDKWYEIHPTTHDENFMYDFCIGSNEDVSFAELWGSREYLISKFNFTDVRPYNPDMVKCLVNMLVKNKNTNQYDLFVSCDSELCEVEGVGIETIPTPLHILTHIEEDPTVLKFESQESFCSREFIFTRYDLFDCKKRNESQEIDIPIGMFFQDDFGQVYMCEGRFKMTYEHPSVSNPSYFSNTNVFANVLLMTRQEQKRMYRQKFRLVPTDIRSVTDKDWVTDSSRLHEIQSTSSYWYNYNNKYLSIMEGGEGNINFQIPIIPNSEKQLYKVVCIST